MFVLKLSGIQKVLFSIKTVNSIQIHFSKHKSYVLFERNLFD